MHHAKIAAGFRKQYRFMNSVPIILQTLLYVGQLEKELNVEQY